MLYILAIVLGIMAGLFAKGRISNLADVRFEKVWLVLAAALTLLVTQVLSGSLDLLSGYSFLINGIIYCIVFIWAWLNRRYMGVVVIAAGAFLNMLVMMVNGGRMPVDMNAAMSAGLSPEVLESDIKHYITSPGDGTRLAFLSDMITLPGFLGYMMRIVSIGDLVVMAGLLMLFFQLVSGKNTLIDIKQLRRLDK